MTSKTRTITLTDRQPVKIRDDDWPMIAVGDYSDYDNQYEFQANRTWKCSIRVRQHDDGRAIVYGVYDYDTAFQGERGIRTKAGGLLDDGDDIPAAINRVAEALSDACSEAGHDDFRAHIMAAARECIADLPAVEI